MYKLQVIVDDRMRDASGALVTTASDANGGELNQGATAGAAPTAVPGTVYDWLTQATLAASDRNIAATTVDIRASLVNETPTFTGTAATVYEDARTLVSSGFVVADPESAAFNTPVTVTLTVDSGTLDVAASGAQGSFTPSGGQAVTITGDTTASVTLTGRAADIQALLNQKNFANNAADTNGGLFYTSATDLNHDFNGAGSAGDVTLTLAFSDVGSQFGSDGAAVNPANIVIPITITEVNDVPTVGITPTTPVAISGATAVGGFSITDPDDTDGSALNVVPSIGEVDFMQVTVRLLPETGTTPLPATGGVSGVDHTNAVFTSSTPGTAAIDTTYNGNGSALVIRGTLAEVNTYLAGLKVELKNGLLNNNVGYRVQVIADDRLRTTGAGGGVLNGTNAANGGLNTDGSTSVANVPTTAVDPYAEVPTLAYNVAANTRSILGSDVNENPKFDLLDNTPTFIENAPVGVVLDANATLSDPELTTYNNWNNAVLTLARQGGANANDVFSFTGGTGVASFTNVGGTLSITFNASATNAIVNSVLQSVTYSNSNDNPPASVTIGYTIDDGDRASMAI